MPNELFIYDEIGPSAWGLIDSKLFASALRDFEPESELTLRINSPGGDVFEGLAMYELLRERPGPVEIKIDALAGSIASVIAMAGDRIVAAPNSYLVIHKPTTFVGGEAPDLRNAADALDKVEETALDIYQSQVGEGDQIRKTLRDQLAVETWFTGPEALAAGLVTEVAGFDQETPTANLGSGLIAYKRTPLALKIRGGVTPAMVRKLEAGQRLRRNQKKILDRRIDLRRPVRLDKIPADRLGS
jgi:ATP-dependent protease ClpP protease subunit